MKALLTYIEDCFLNRLQKRCKHPGNMVAADILEGCVDDLQVKYCHRCGSVKTDWKPQPKPGQPSKFMTLEHYWRRPDPHLWRG